MAALTGSDVNSGQLPTGTAPMLVAIDNITMPGGGGGGGGASTIADGADVAQGTTTDTAIVTNANGTVIGFLRGLVTLIAARIPALGQALAVGSTPVVLPVTQITTLTPPAAITNFASETGGNLAIAVASLSVMDDWDESDRAKVNPIVGQAGVAAGAGAVGATVPRVTLASDDPAVATLGATSGAAVITDANGTIQQYLRGLVKLLVTSGTIILGAGSNAIGKLAANVGVNIGVVGGTTIETSDEFARVADTNAYAVGDAIGATVSNTGTTPLRGITVASANGGTGYITKFRLWTDQAGCVAQIRIHFYTVAAPATALVGDNILNIANYANRAQALGYVDMPALSGEAGTNTGARASDMTTRLPFQCDPADTKLYYRLQTQTVFTPANAQNFYLALTSERNGS